MFARNIAFVHCIDRFDVPGRKITDSEYQNAMRIREPLAAKEDLSGGEPATKSWYKKTIRRYETQQSEEPHYAIEMHTLRLGDVAIATNPFELFVDFGMQIQGRSPAEQTIMIQLASQVEDHSYRPSERAVQGGGYSAIPESSLVGPNGGQVLVEKTAAGINEMFDPK